VVTALDTQERPALAFDESGELPSRQRFHTAISRIWSPGRAESIDG
jgi:hypothetical protein